MLLTSDKQPVVCDIRGRCANCSPNACFQVRRMCPLEKDAINELFNTGDGSWWLYFHSLYSLERFMTFVLSSSYKWCFVLWSNSERDTVYFCIYTLCILDILKVSLHLHGSSHPSATVFSSTVTSLIQRVITEIILIPS